MVVSNNSLLNDIKDAHLGKVMGLDGEIFILSDKPITRLNGTIIKAVTEKQLKKLLDSDLKFIFKIVSSKTSINDNTSE